jgi:hypothetical protein
VHFHITHLNVSIEEFVERSLGGGEDGSFEAEAAVGAGGVRLEPLHDAVLVENALAHAMQPDSVAAADIALLTDGTGVLQGRVSWKDEARRSVKGGKGFRVQ